MNAPPTTPLRVAFDHWIFTDQPRGGISRGFAGMIPHMREVGIVPKVTAPFYVADALRRVDRRDVWGVHLPFNRRNQLIAKAVGRASNRALARLFGAQVVHETYYSATPTAPAGVPVVLTVYDMIHELYPELFHPTDSTLRNKPGALARADRILCISEHTRRDLLRFYPEVEDKAVTVLFGFDAAFNAAPDGPREHALPFVLYLGIRRGYKNFDGLLEAYARSRLPAEGIDLVCVGDGPLRPPEAALAERLGIAGQVIQREADDEQLRRLYRDALLFAYPSLYEGFGIPPLEAMAAGCPVVAVRAASVPEVCGDAAEYGEPGDIASLADALDRVALSPAHADALRAAGRDQCRRFSWRRCAHETAAIYRTLA